MQLAGNKKPRREYGALIASITRVMEKGGEMTRADICAELGLSHDRVSAVISRMHRDTPVTGKQVYICRYVFDAEGKRRYPRAVYALGNLPDAKKPASQRKENRRRYEENRKARVATVRLDSAGWTRRQIIAFMRKLKGVFGDGAQGRRYSART